jgi:hypothetical protein
MSVLFMMIPHTLGGSTHGTRTHSIPPLRATSVVHPYEYSISPSPHRTLRQQPEWEEGGEYDEQPPQYVCYTIEYKFTFNHKKVGSATEKDIAITSSDYWVEFLKTALENMVQSKRKRNQWFRSESTTIRVSVNDRMQSPLEKFYSSTNVNWTPVENQLRKWSNLLCSGKRLTIAIVTIGRRIMVMVLCLHQEEARKWPRVSNKKNAC